jgi:uncharacterized GH25 family protein
MIKKSLLVTLLVPFATAAIGHDFWIQPNSFQVLPNRPLPLTVLVGHGKDRQRWPGDASYITTFADLAPNGRIDLRDRFRAFGRSVDVFANVNTPGLHIFVVQTRHASSELPFGRFNDYIREEGLTPIISARSRSGTFSKSGREIYSRRAKALVQVGPSDGSANPRTRIPVGLSLEIIPERDPYALGSDRILPVHILYEGRRLPGALVKLRELHHDEQPVATALTDRHGRAAFRVPATGQWLINVVWSKPLKGDVRADFDTTFSSLTFGYDRLPTAR